MQRDKREQAEDALRKLLEAMKAELAEKTAKKLKIEKEVSKLEDDVERISIVLRSLSGTGETETEKAGGLPDFSNTSVTKGAYIILKNTGKPLHVNEIAKRLKKAGKVMKAKKLYNMIYTVLGRDPKFVKTDPGTYGLEEWYKSEF